MIKLMKRLFCCNKISMKMYYRKRNNNYILFMLVSIFYFISSTKSASSQKVPALPLPKYIGKGCSLNDPKLNECVVKKGQAAIKTITSGDSKYRIPKLDPLVLEQIKIDQGTRQVGLSLELNKCEMHGLTNTKFVSANVDVKKNHCEWNFFLDKLLILGKYNVSGQVLVLPIIGNGNANITASNVTFSYIYDWKLNKKANGLDYVEVTDNKMPFDVGDLKIHLANLFNGDKLLGDNMNQFLNENWREIMKELGPAMGEALGEIFRRTLTSMAELVPYQNIFPPN